MNFVQYFSVSHSKPAKHVFVCHVSRMMNTHFLLIRCFFFVLESEAATSNPPDKESKSDSSSAEPKSEDAVKSEDSGVISAVKEPSVEDELQAKLTLEDEKSSSDPKTEVEPTKAEKS